MTGLEKAKKLFHEAGLAFPQIPQELAVKLKEQSNWLFSTRKVDESPYHLLRYVVEAEQFNQEDFAILAHSGYGLNSYAIQYYLVHDPLRLFLHLGWGGVYMDPTATTNTINECFILANEINKKVQSLSHHPLNRALFVVATEFYGCSWWLKGQNFLDEIKKHDHKRPQEILAEVLQYLNF